MEEWKYGNRNFVWKSLLTRANKKFGNIKHQYGRMEVWKYENVFFIKHISLTVG
jgi:hypothetical protein